MGFPPSWKKQSLFPFRLFPVYLSASLCKAKEGVGVTGAPSKQPWPGFGPRCVREAQLVGKHLLTTLQSILKSPSPGATSSAPTSSLAPVHGVKVLKASVSKHQKPESKFKKSRHAPFKSPGFIKVWSGQQKGWEPSPGR